MTILLLFYVLILWPQASWPGMQPAPPALGSEVLSIGPSGKSLKSSTSWVTTVFIHFNSGSVFKPRVFEHACSVASLVSNALRPSLWTVGPQAPLSMEFSRQEYWSELPCLPPGDLPNPKIEPTSQQVGTLGQQYALTHRTYYKGTENPTTH